MGGTQVPRKRDTKGVLAERKVEQRGLLEGGREREKESKEVFEAE